MSDRLFSKRQVEGGAGIALLFVSALFVSCLAASSPPELPEPATEKPIWTIDLHKLGFARDQEPGFTFFGFPSHYSISSFDTNALAFTSRNQLAVAFVTHDVKGTKGEPVPGSWQLHFATIDAATGNIIAMRDSPTRVGFPPLFATHQGNFLLEENYKIILYSPKLEKLNELDTELLKFDRGYEAFEYSADGRHIYITSVTSDPHAPQILRVFDADSLQESRSQSTESGAWPVSDSHLAMWQEQKDLYRRSLYLRSGAEWKEIYRDTGCGTPFYSAHLLTENDVVIISCNKLTVADAGGKVSFQQEVPSNRPFEKRFGASSNGRRFAVSLGESKGVEIPALDLGRSEIPWRLIVYDSQDRAAVSSFELRGKPFSFVLSSDGSEVALLRSGVLELFRLPVPSSKTREIKQ